ncbi:tRNA (adenine(58)-N(1))-methyltransferase non-catalytic subunit TRM6-like [Dendronephthya gigantea]|uniref:tRNA (adenine(58)-N(1))-methyltransferase non-catalytic subunit TRM6-like n=1 Tax=Dendronephthya gigantea TaxID=151771 RepID=UPI0010691CEA|nr:tRNA (adenine(58)-N(1))-methyltransferase non-catalytic subunit TRM6-like [Dendronephthya gigantea]
MSEATIEEGNRVIIQNGTYMRSEVVHRRKKVNVQKLNFYLDNAIGCKYGTTFDVGKKGQLIVPPVACSDQPLKPTTSSGENNQFLNDDGSSQKLTKDAIMDLKEQGVKGEVIIEQLVENSESFKKKTEFSQEKYLKKKRKRHLLQITILKPTLRLVCEMIYANGPSKILDLRMDTVSQILTMANIRSNVNVLLMETTQSFLAGAILHRMGGLGNVVQLYHGDFPIRLLLPHFDLGVNEMGILSGIPITKINRLQSLETEDVPPEFDEEMDSVSDGTTEIAEQTSERKEESSTAKEENPPAPQRRSRKGTYHKPLTEKEKLTRKINRIDEDNRSLKLLKSVPFDSLIIATKFRAKTAVLRLIEFLAPSRPFVVYSQYKEVLSECLDALKETKSAINLDLTDTWWRSYQVLSMRTHPHIMMDGTGGYLLTGIKVDNGECPAVNPNLAPNPVNPTNPGKRDVTDRKSITSDGPSYANPDGNRVDTNSCNFKDNLEIKTDPEPDENSAEPPSKRPKSD